MFVFFFLFFKKKRKKEKILYLGVKLVNIYVYVYTQVSSFSYSLWMMYNIFKSDCPLCLFLEETRRQYVLFEMIFFSLVLDSWLDIYEEIWVLNADVQKKKKGFFLILKKMNFSKLSDYSNDKQKFF